MRNIFDSYSGAADVVEDQLSESYLVVKEVHSNLGAIQTAVDNIQAVIDATPAAEQAALSLTIIQNLAAGAIYDTTTQGLDPVTGVLDGEFFATWEGDRMRIYLNSGGVAVLKTEMVTAASVNALMQAAYIDFTTKADGDPPSVLDSGQAVDFVFNAGGRKPKIVSGRLVVDTPPVSGGLADYYQSDLGAPVTRVGAEWTMPAGADDGNGNATIAAWDGYYEGGGTNVPRSWIHMSIVPGTGATGSALWFVCNGIGNLLAVKSQTFTNPPADGQARWRVDAVLDLPAGMAYARLPDGSIMSLSNAEIAAFCTAVSVTPFTFAQVSSKVIMCEHYATTSANTAKFCGFTALWGETESSEPKPWKDKSTTLLDELRTGLSLSNRLPPSISAKVYAPTTAMAVATTAAMATVDSTNAVISCRAGPTGSIVYDIAALYDFTGTDTVFWRLVINGGIGSTTIHTADLGVSGQKRVARQTVSVSGLIPFTLYSATLQHSAVTGGLATLRAGGSGGATVPPLSLAAFPS